MLNLLKKEYKFKLIKVFVAKICLLGECCSTTMSRKLAGSASVGAIALISPLMVLGLNCLVV